MEESKIQKFICYLLCDNFIAKKYRLKKFNNMLIPIGLDNIKNLIENSRDENITRTLTKIKEEELIQVINYFKKVLEKNFKKEDLNNFFYNKEWVEIIIKNFYLKNIILNTSMVGQYDVKKNKLYFIKNRIDESIYHELFHLASTDSDSNNMSTGFSLDIGSSYIGDALNEGYTQLLAERYFNETDDSYVYETRVAHNLEMIIGKNKMQSLYMNTDFFGLVEELEKYYSKKEIEKFLVNLDIVSKYIPKTLISIEEIDKINQLMDEIACFLFKGYCKIISNKKYEKQVIKDSLENYLFIINIRYNNVPISIFKINKIIEEFLGSEYKLDLNILKTEEVCYNK